MAGTPAAATTDTPAEIQAALTLLNNYRAQFGIGPVVDDPGMDAGSRAHAQYMYDHGGIGHTEDPTAPDYTPQGLAAAQCGDEFGGLASLSDAITGWMRAPYHEALLLAPGFSEIGVGRVGEDESLTCATQLATGPGVAPGPPPSGPLTFPADGATLPWLAWWGGETPDPRTACADPSIAPASVNGANVLVGGPLGVGTITSYDIVVNGPTGPLPTCAFTAFGAIAAITLQPLDPLTHYTWVATIKGSAGTLVINRSFTTGPAVPQHITEGWGGDGQGVAVTPYVYDQRGLPLPGAVVTFTEVPHDGSPASVVGTCTTGVDGSCTVELPPITTDTTLVTSSGDAVLSLELSTAPALLSISYRQTASTFSLIAWVDDQQDRGVPGQTVTFTGQSGTGSPAVLGSCVTGADGSCVLAIERPAQPTTYSATSGSLNTMMGTTVAVGVPASVAIGAEGNANGPVQLDGYVFDILGDPVAGATVSFSKQLESGGASSSVGSCVTNVNGFCSVSGVTSTVGTTFTASCGVLRSGGLTLSTVGPVQGSTGAGSGLTVGPAVPAGGGGTAGTETSTVPRLSAHETVAQAKSGLKKAKLGVADVFWPGGRMKAPKGFRLVAKGFVLEVRHRVRKHGKWVTQLQLVSVPAGKHLPAGTKLGIKVALVRL